MSTEQLLAVAPRLSPRGSGRPPGRGHLRRSNFRWAVAFVAPYAAVFFAFVVYPFGYALWMASKPSLYADLITDPLYLPTVVNTLLFVGLGVNIKMFLALLLSGFFLRRRWWIRALLAFYVLPWLIAAAQACISFHWILPAEMDEPEYPALRDGLAEPGAWRELMDRRRGLAALFVALALAGCAPVAVGSGQAPNAPFQQDDARDTGGMH